MLKTEKEGNIYNELPLKIRLGLKTIVWLLHKMYPYFEKHDISPIFGLYKNKEEEEEIVEEEYMQ